MSDCIFCRIVRGDIPATLVHQDDEVVAFRDIQPQAPVHVLIVPRQHIPSLRALTEDLPEAVARIPQVAARIAEQMGVAESGYRLVCNCGAHAGQTVHHLHYHLLGGRPMSGEMV